MVSDVGGNVVQPRERTPSPGLFVVGAEQLLDRQGHRVGVLGRCVVQAYLRSRGHLTGRSCRDSGAVVRKDTHQNLNNGELLCDSGQLEPAIVAQFVGDDVDVVLGAAASQHRVEQLPGFVACDDPVHDVGSQALGGVDGGGVAELDVPVRQAEVRHPF